VHIGYALTRYRKTSGPSPEPLPIFRLTRRHLAVHCCRNIAISLIDPSRHLLQHLARVGIVGVVGEADRLVFSARIAVMRIVE